MRSAIRWFGENFPTLLLAFVLAIAVWVSAVVAADPNEQHVLRPITLELIGGAPDMVQVEPISTQVRLTIKAPRSIWTQLNNNPNQAHAWIDLTGLEAGRTYPGCKSAYRYSPNPIGADRPGQSPNQIGTAGAAGDPG